MKISALRDSVIDGFHCTRHLNTCHEVLLPLMTDASIAVVCSAAVYEPINFLRFISEKFCCHNIGTVVERLLSLMRLFFLHLSVKVYHFSTPWRSHACLPV
jgi:hypothetical protein